MANLDITTFSDVKPYAGAAAQTVENIYLAALEVVNVERYPAAQNNISTGTLAGRDGSFVTSTALEPLIIEVEGVLAGQTVQQVAEKRRYLAKALGEMVNRPGHITLPDDDDVGAFYEVYYKQSESLGRLYHRPHVRLTFYAPTPYAHGEVVTGSISDGGSLTLHVDGNAPMWPVFSLNATGSQYPAVEYRAVDDDFSYVYGGQIQYVAGTVPTGATLEIDTETTQTVINGTTPLAPALASFFGPITPRGTSGGTDVLITCNGCSGTVSIENRYY